MDKEELMEKYKEIRINHIEAANSGWMSKYHRKLYIQINRQIGKWDEFKQLCGYEDNLCHRYSKEELIEKYIKIRNGNLKSISSLWMQQNGYYGIYSQIKRKFNNWDEFKQLCGYEDNLRISYNENELIFKYKEIRQKYPESVSSEWLIKNGYSALYQQINKKFVDWNYFKNLCGYSEELYIKYSKEELIKEYKTIRKEHTEAQSFSWMRENGYYSIIQQAYRKIDGGWNGFKKLCGYSDPIQLKVFEEKTEKIINELGLIYKREYTIESTNYSVDFMIYDFDFLLEIDEKHHIYQRESDVKRQNIIENITGLKIIRIEAIDMKKFEEDLRKLFKGYK